MRFSFTGKLGAKGLEAKNPYLRKGKTVGGSEYEALNLSVSSAPNNTAFVELFAMKPKDDVIRTMDTENNKIEIAWHDRQDPSVVEKVANYRKHVISIGDGQRREFITDWDAAEYIIENIEDLKGSTVVITGRTTKDFYNGKSSDRFQLQNMYVANDDAKPALKLFGEMFWTTDDVDSNDWGSERKLYINGYTREYIDKEIGNKYVQQQFIFDASKVDVSNQKLVDLVKFKLGMLGLDVEKGKIKSKLKKGNVYRQSVIVSYINGAEEVPFDESCLTDSQKEAIAVGLKTLDDFRPNGSIYGNRVVQYKIVNFDINGDYADGYVEDDMSASEFESEKYVPQKEEAVEEIMNAPENDNSDLDDLFG